MLSVSNLTKTYGSRALLSEAGFTLSQGERVGLVGRNGSGKTTLFKMILKEARPDEGSISVPSGYRVRHLEQHINFTEPTVLGEACLALPGHEDGTDETYKAESVLMGLGFSPEMFEMDPRALSGGFQVRLNLVKALVSEPDLLLLDEPTNYLDIISIRWLKSFLRSWPREFMLITHDRAFMDSVTTHTLGINRGRLIKVEGGTEKYYNRILMEEELYEKERVNDERKRRDAERFISRFRAQATRARAVQSRIKQMNRLHSRDKLPVEKDLSFSFDYEPFIGKFMIELNELSFGYTPEAPLIKGLNLLVRPGDRIAVVGRNGAGKTTLLNLLAGEMPPSSGSISINPKSALSCFGQTNVERLRPDKTVEEEIMDASVNMGQKAARNIAGAMMFEGDAALKKTRLLSGGEKSRVLLGRILASRANVLLLDEPSNHLDVESVDSLLAAIDNFEGAVIIVTHSEMVLDAIAERLIVFDSGRAWVFEGTYQEFLSRHGFSSEGPTGPVDSKSGNGLKNMPTGPVASTASSLKSVDKRELKRLRAKLINERSRTLNPMKKKMASLETSIMALEADVEACEHELVAASASGQAGVIAELSKKMHEARERIETQFEELTRLSDEHAREEALFEQRLAELS